MEEGHLIHRISYMHAPAEQRHSEAGLITIEMDFDGFPSSIVKMWQANRSQHKHMACSLLIAVDSVILDTS